MAKPSKLPEWDATQVNSVEPDATHKAEGWIKPAGVPEKPPLETFNYWQNEVYRWLTAINDQGILDWDATTDYGIDAIAKGSDGKVYVSVSASNTNNDPTTEPEWQEYIGIETFNVNHGYLAGDVVAYSGMLYVAKSTISASAFDRGEWKSLFTGKNILINGNPLINQREASGTVVLAAGEYGHDRWKAGSGGCTYTFSTTLNVVTIDISAGSLIQIIEGENLQSGTHTLSWTGTAQGKIGAGSFSDTGVTGVAVGGTDLNIEFGTGTFSLAQFEFGPVATDFEFRSFGAELSLCQRYFEKSYEQGTAPGTATSTGAFYELATRNTTGQATIVVGFFVIKRALPTITLYSTSGASGVVLNTTDKAATASFSTRGIAFINITSGVANDNVIGQYTADAEL